MFEKIRDIIVEQLNVDASEVTMEANLSLIHISEPTRH